MGIISVHIDGLEVKRKVRKCSYQDI